MATKFEDPLLSLTVSTTLREKPLPITPPRQAIAALLQEVGGSADPLDLLSPIKSALGPSAGSNDQEDDEDLLSGLEEINLLEGLQAGDELVYICQTRDAHRLSQSDRSYILPRGRCSAKASFHSPRLEDTPNGLCAPSSARLLIETPSIKGVLDGVRSCKDKAAVSTCKLDLP